MLFPMEVIQGLQLNTTKGTVSRIVSLLAGKSRGKILDAPAGSGALSRILLKKGFDVLALDLDREGFLAREAPFLSADLNGRLPFLDQVFDYVFCVDGIEHLENPYHTIREFERVLNPGGELFLSTPNISALRSRLRYLFTGFHNKRKRPLNERKHSSLDHIGMIGFPELRYALHRAGLRLQVIASNRVKVAAWPSILLYPFVAIFTKVAFRHEKDVTQRHINREIFYQMLSWPLVMGETLILSVEKPGKCLQHSNLACENTDRFNTAGLNR
jgi:SAM-dependent methyltransferase